VWRNRVVKRAEIRRADQDYLVFRQMA